MTIEQNIDRLIRINKSSSDELATLLDTFVRNKINFHSMQFYSLNILYRIVFYQRGILPLLNEFKSNSSYELPIAIILRAACLDILQYGYIMNCIDDNLLNETTEDNPISHDNISNALNDIYSGNIKHQIGDWQCMKVVGRISHEQFDLWKNELITSFSYFYTEDTRKSESAQTLFKKLRSNSKYTIYSEAFIDYAYYSKLEHFGILSNAFSKHDTKSTEIAVNRLLNITVTLLFLSKTGLSFLSLPEEKLAKFDTWMNQILITEPSSSEL